MPIPVQFSLSEQDYSDYSGDDADFDTEEEEELSAAEMGIVPEFLTKDSGKAHLTNSFQTSCFSF